MLTTRADARVQPNSLGTALGLLGDEWTLLLVKSAFEGARRYGDWKAALPISDAVLTARLRRLVADGVLRRVPYRSAPLRHEYRLTPAGLDLWRLLLSIWDWERHHAQGQAARLPRMVHTACDAEFHPVLACPTCSHEVGWREVDAAFGPSGSFARSVPAATTRRRSLRADTTGTSTGPGLFPETMAIIGNRWSSAVVGAAFLGAARFSDFERVLAVAPAILSDRLRTFVACGVLDADEGTREYRLSAKGQDLFPVVVALVTWAERWHPATEGPAIVATHRPCGRALRLEWACSGCHQPLTPATVTIVPAST